MSRAKFALLTVILGFLVVFSTAQSTDNILKNAGSVIRQTVEFVSDCGDKTIMYCLKERALKYLDSAPSNIELMEGIVLKTTSPKSNERQNITNSSPPDEPKARNDNIDSLLMDRIFKFCSSHTLEFKMPNSAVTEMKREMSKQEGRKKKKKFLLPLLILLKLKAAVVLPLLLGGIALLAFKSLIIGKVALVITAIVAIKKILENKDTSQSYEVVTHPHHTHSHVNSFDEHHGPYRRALVQDPNNIPYSAYVSNLQ